MIYKRGGCDKNGPDGRCSRCGKKRGTCGMYWYKFMWQGKLVRESTKQGNDDVARQMEAAHRTSLAKGEVGIRERKPVPTLADFCKKRFEPWCESATSPKTWRDFYRVGILAIKGYAPLASLTLDCISSEKITDFASHQQARGLQVSSVNSSLRILRRVFAAADERRIHADSDHCCRSCWLVRGCSSKLRADPQRMVAQCLRAPTGVNG